MGTRADFYIKTKDKDSDDFDYEWLGSIGWDGYPSGIDKSILKATRIKDYRILVKDYIVQEGGTLPEQGWPWPWKTSATTDYAYILYRGKVWASCFGGLLFDPLKREPMPPEYPDMSEIQKVAQAGSQRSGLIAISQI
jgi:hypothetical protein